jgi:4-diphosphocytidyl-2-C-methyl-D-erythritol kinase
VSGAGLRAQCPAKVNLFLHVLGKRIDGYHEIRTLFQAIDLWDTLDAHPAPTVTLSCDDAAIPEGDDNLVVRAARLFIERTGALRGAALRLAKRIPAGGGLGGGSSNAAATLVLLDRLTGGGTPKPVLEAMASELGSDVPFFLTGGTALGTGRGERIQSIADAEPLALVIGSPPFAISTADVYALFAARSPVQGPLTPRVNDVSLSRLATHKLLGGNNFESVSNDLEAVVFDAWPELAGFRDALLEVGAVRAIVSGSGSSVFGIFHGPGDARGAAKRLTRSFARWILRPCGTIRDAIRVGPAPARSG